MKKVGRELTAICVAAAMVLTAMIPVGAAEAASKPKLATKTISVKVKKSKTIKIKKKRKCKITFKSKNKKIATVSSKGKVTGKKKGNTKIMVYYKKGKAAKKKLGTVKVKVTAAGKVVQSPAPTAGTNTTVVPSATAPTVSKAPAVSQDPAASANPSQTPEVTPEASPEGPTPIPSLDPDNLVTVDYPTLYSDIPDLDIIRVGGNYYMVSTTMNMCPGVPIMKSTDLVHWQIVNYVYDTFEDDDVTNMENGKQMYSHGSWAASLKYNEAEGKFYVAFNSNDHGFYIYTTTDIESGTWEKHSIKSSFHDPALLFDDEKLYVISGGNLQQLELDDEAGTVNKVGSSVKLLEKSADWSLWEGTHAYKIGEYYYLCIIASPSDRWMRTEVCYRSKTLEAGNWEEQIIYQGGSGGSGSGLAQGGVVDTAYGDWYGFLFQDRGGVGRIPSIVAVNWDYTDSEGNSYKDWPMMGTYDADGNFQPSVSSNSMKINLNDSGLDNYFVANDEFTYTEGEKLKLVWQWNHNPQNDYWSVSSNPGYLRLTTDRTVDNIYYARNSLTQRTYGPTCKSETKISVANMKAGDYAGLASVADHAGMVGVMCDENGDKYITQAGYTFPAASATSSTEQTKINAQVELGDATEVYLKIEYNFGSGDKANFFYSLDGSSWTKIGTQQSLAFSTSTTFMGARTWLFNYATQEAGGYVDFDYYKIED